MGTINVMVWARVITQRGAKGSWPPHWLYAGLCIVYTQHFTMFCQVKSSIFYMIMITIALACIVAATS